MDAFKGMQLGAHNVPEVYIEFDNGMSRCKSSLPGVSSSDWMTMKALMLEPGGVPVAAAGTASSCLAGVRCIPGDADMLASVLAAYK